MYQAPQIANLCRIVSMKSGLEGRNNDTIYDLCNGDLDIVSMKSGLEGRNNGGRDHKKNKERLSQ